MNERYLRAAEVINTAYDVRSTCDLKKHYDYFIVYDDDITAVLKSVSVYRRLKKINPQMKMLVVGGEGLLATAFKVMRLALWVKGNTFALSLLKKETEAQRLKRVALRLGVKESDILVSDSGSNTTQNLQAMSQIAKGKKAVVVATQRLAMVFKQSADFQCNRNPEKFGCEPFDYDMLVIHQSVAETLRWYNFQTAGSGRVALQLYASLVRRFEVYDGKFLTKPFEPDEATQKANELLCKKFTIKQRLSGVKGLMSYFEYIPIIWDIFCNPEEYVLDEMNAVEEALEELEQSES